MCGCPSCRTVYELQPQFCPSCGYQFASDARANTPRKSGPYIVVGLVVFIIVLVVIARIGVLSDAPGFFIPAQPEAARDSGGGKSVALGGIFSPVVTRQNYEAISSGMSYERVSAIIGRPGEELSRSDIAGYTTVMYSWKNLNGSNMNAMFKMGVL